MQSIQFKFLIFIIVITCIMASINCGQPRYESETAKVLAAMTEEQKIGALMMVSVPGREMGKEVIDIITNYHPGGIILFGFNIGNADDLRVFIAGMQRLSVESGGFPLFVSLDQEGGRVKRIIDGVTQFPGNMAAGIAGDPELAYQWARIIGMQLRLLGVNMDLAPVLDVNNNPANPVINTRSFGSDPALVALLGSSFIRGLQDAFCIAVGKHFPGHGDTNLDSHRTLPSIGYDLARLRALELVPFIRAVGVGVSCIMTAHISFPAILENDDPATISRFFLEKVLREELGFQGLVITDDLEMRAVSERMRVGEGAVRAVMAGADMVLISTHGSHVPEIFHALKDAVRSGRIPASRLDESVRRIMALKMKYRIARYDEHGLAAGGSPYSDRDMSLLKNAGSLNREISRKGILYAGNARVFSASAPSLRIAVTSNSHVMAALKGSDVTVLQGFDAAAVKSFRQAKGEGAVLFYHVQHDNPGPLRGIADACARIGIPLVAVSGENPFPLTRSGAASNYLLSFSNTDESLYQLGCCIKGEFTPKMDAPLSLGIPAHGDAGGR